jgi:MFS superfamily sulfate permease-like transporter
VSITARNGFGSCHCAGDGGSFRSSATSRGGIAVLDWLRGYRGEWLRLDIVAGLTTAAVVVPKAMAYATVAALPVEVGLYTAFVPMVIYAILGTSRPLSDSTTITLAILTGTQLALVVPGGDPTAWLTASATLAVLVGIMLILASVLRG